MANAQRGEVALAVGERRFTLRFSNNALADLEEALRMPISELLVRGQAEQVGVRELRAMLWAALRGKHPRITLTEAGDLLDEIGLETASAKIAESIKLAFPQQENGQGNGPAAGGSGTAS